MAVAGTGLGLRVVERCDAADRRSLTPSTPKVEAGDFWTPMISVRRGRAPVVGAGVTLRVGAKASRAAPVGAGRYRARIQLREAGRLTYTVRVNGRRVGSGRFVVNPVRLHGTYDAVADGSVFIADFGNNHIARLRGGVVTTAADLAGANGVAAAPDGSIYVTERALPRVLGVDPATGPVTTVAGS